MAEKVSLITGCKPAAAFNPERDLACAVFEQAFDDCKVLYASMRKAKVKAIDSTEHWQMIKGKTPKSIRYRERYFLAWQAAKFLTVPILREDRTYWSDILDIEIEAIERKAWELFPELMKDANSFKRNEHLIENVLTADI